ncbi:hypothetical protein AM493_07615 [Flavobacterium akiainvivens]|uniref:Secretion system C-terminal sorting domain-containing protein n=1 Tax=Flavobacterium akiainvivens TaxID=1202724 RepID=A0A0M8M8U7_9FLAO|nr:T9SS type A sorting domain-containing protein [Flavobacterium akiainvivens]KOS05913.1 hypothetical protein AM493_07615 [Flavobacterium akiainvivens]SFQ53170.1 Por secretion system C-terminal sorting domain-containing protein [Flavobacterium akiainvivens]
MKKITLAKGVSFAALALMLGGGKAFAQTYTWNGGTSNFYTTSNWNSSDGPVLFDNGGFRVVHVNNTGTSPILSEFIDWQPGIFDNYGGNFTVNADFNVFFNDFLNGTVTVNSGATFLCRHIMRVGREGQGTVNINGTMRCNNADPEQWQGIFIGVLANGNGTVNVNDGGLIDGGFQVEVGTRNNYPVGVLNVETGGTSSAYWNTVIGPNGTVNVNGGTINCGQGLIVGDLFVDTPGTEGSLGAVVGTLNINSGIVTVNNNDLAAPYLGLHENSKVTIDNGTLRIMRTGVDFSSDINAHIQAGKIVPVSGKEIVVNYDGIYTTVTAQAVTSAKVFENQFFTIAPNPVADVLNISAADGSIDNVIISIYDLLGKEVLKTNTNIAASYNVSALPSGIYVVKVQSPTASSVVKVVKQ